MAVAVIAFAAGVAILSHTIYGTVTPLRASAKNQMLPLQRLAGVTTPDLAAARVAVELAPPATSIASATRPIPQPTTETTTSLDRRPVPEASRGASDISDERAYSAGNAVVESSADQITPAIEADSEPTHTADSDKRIYSFNGRLIRPRTTMTMRVTAYSPDRRSCGNWADGITASGRRVSTNGGRLVAADTRILPFGAIVSIPGYHDGEPVPVLDRGGAIKGYRLDLLYPTHARARQWGVQDLEVTIWEYAD